MPEFVVFIPTFVLLGGAVAVLLADLLPYPTAKGWVAVGAVGISLASVLTLTGRQWPVEATLFVWEPGTPELEPVSFSYFFDAISFISLLCSLFVALSLTIYATHYVAREPKRQLVFYFVFLLAAAGFTNLVLAGNMLVLYISLQAWMLASVAAVSFWHHGLDTTPAIVRSFILASLPSTGILLAALILAGRNPGLAFSAISPQSVAPALSFLFLISAAAVAHQYPFHPWTAISLRAPLPAAALLGVVFSPWVGVYLLSRFQAIAGVQADTIWHLSLMVVGAFSMLAGAVYTLKQTHLRGIAIFIACSQFGYAFLGLGINTAASVGAALLVVLSSTLALCGLLVCAGMIERSAGTGSVLKLGSLAGRMPRTTLFFAFFSISLAGVPFPTVGFFAKWVILGAAMDAGHTAFGVLTLVVDVLVFVMLMRTMDWVFFRRCYRDASTGAESARLPLVSAGLLAAPLALFGIAPTQLTDWVVKPAVSVIMHLPVQDLRVSLAGGFSSPSFLGSALTFMVMLVPPLIGLIAYMISMGNGVSRHSVTAGRVQEKIGEGDQVESLLDHGSTAWFPWVINTSGIHAALWQVVLSIARVLRVAMSPAEAGYSPAAIVLAAITVLLALLE